MKSRLTGIEQVLANLDALGRTLRNRILRKAINEGARLVLKEAKKLVPVRTGMLKKSLGVRIVTYRHNGVVMGIIGPRTGFAKAKVGRKQTAFGRKIKETGINPSKYAHLVEYGHRIVRDGTLRKGTGRVVGVAPPHAFLVPAFENTKSEVTALVAKRIGEELEKTARQLKK